jgi:integrase
MGEGETEDSMRLQDAFDQCMQTQWKGTRGETTAQINGEAALAFFGPRLPLSKLSTHLLDSWVLRLKAIGNKPATINRKLAVVSAILRWAHRRGELAAMPYVPYQKRGQGRSRWLTDVEQSQMLTALTKRGLTDHAQAIEVLVDTGLRPSELWRLTAKDYRAGALMITGTKNDTTRLIPLTQRATFIIERRLVRYADGPLFPHDNSWMEYGWNLAKKDIGLANDTEFVVYALRHTCASRLLQRDVPLPVIQGWLGHTNPAQTMKYAHLSQTNFQQAMKKLEGGAL